MHEQHAEDLHTLVEEFRRKNAELRSERLAFLYFEISDDCQLLVLFRPNCNNSLFNAWDSFLNETESDAQAHTDIAGVLGRSVSRPLLEKTFHMKIQSRTVFMHRESFESILDKTEQMLLKVSVASYIKILTPLNFTEKKISENGRGQMRPPSFSRKIFFITRNMRKIRQNTSFSISVP